LHGGTVSAESAGPGQGAEFVVRLPLLGTAAPPAHSLPAGAAPALPCKRILVVDDNRDAADTLAELLKLHGHATRVAFDAPTALQVAAEFQPEAAFLDLGLPGMSGYELAQALWALPHLGALPVFAVSGYGQAEDRRRTTSQGFTGHLVKPVSSEQLAATLHDTFTASRGQAG
jgi:CheY-like chemotaxis protein